ncbi:hypothetical protein PHJA_001894900 [Phtheirospermum japonicum]|uniref:Uncharacterized protein n=1 Tax=Phtheirospermum japonicum TaxID=374723 RepID=A0A830CJQ3_9LAMI|nr:hypothetical protein PHJA_001894900 [Phtheirospermum japonicum]
MDNETVIHKEMKVEIPENGGLSRQGSVNNKSNCLCSPTTHVGSFRCRLHRGPSLQRTRSMDSQPKLNKSLNAN